MTQSQRMFYRTAQTVLIVLFATIVSFDLFPSATASLHIENEDFAALCAAQPTREECDNSDSLAIIFGGNFDLPASANAREHRKEVAALAQRLLVEEFGTDKIGVAFINRNSGHRYRCQSSDTVFSCVTVQS